MMSAWSLPVQNFAGSVPREVRGEASRPTWGVITDPMSVIDTGAHIVHAECPTG